MMNTFKEHVFEKEFWHNIKLVPNHKLIFAKQMIEKKKAFKVKIGQWKAIKIYLVDGDVVKIKHDMDFVEAGNSAVKHYIPKNEVWLDAHLDLEDIPFNICHEIVEFFHMETYDMDYEKAHNIANVAEKQMRIAHEHI